ncbi:MAG: hypothetical protein H6732_00235 [Alphaproteobacteria bacterium]|nr:hypothetical protein [Alphaproteobacteria bacterium]
MRLLVLLLLLALPAHAGRKRAPDADAPEEAPAARAPRAKAPFPDTLPVDLGPLPDGLANASAQACHACHPAVTEAWRGSAHARGVTPALAEAARAAGSPACLSCHLPLRQQHARDLLGSSRDPLVEVGPPNPAWSPTLQLEGVTCAACHVRRGAVVGASPTRPAPHTTAWTDALGSPEACATCHQLTWPGATQPFYDTYGEWQGSPWAAAGVTCQDCHMGADVSGHRSHAVTADLRRALSVLVGVGAPAVVRGGAPVALSVTLQNTGAGHHLPSGSPYTSLEVWAVLERQGERRVILQERLGQTVGDAPPWPILADTRIPAGESRRLDASLALDQGDPADGWALVVEVVRSTDGALDGAASLVQRLPLVVE